MRHIASFASNTARWRGMALVLLMALAGGHAFAQADPPSRVARLNLAEGSVSFAPAGDNEWVAADLNRPLTGGDRLWTDRGSRAELHAGSAALRMDGQTSVDITALDDQATQLSLLQGTINVRVRDLAEAERFEINTPNLAVRFNQPGSYHVDIDPAAGLTHVAVISGSATAFGESGKSLQLSAGQQAAFTGRDLAQSSKTLAGQTAFDQWALDRDRAEDQSITARYVPRDVIGYQQLDNFGDWSTDPALGPIWIPRAMPATWAPYRYGHWSWIAPWGWTWIDDARWGFAPFHYGRWTQVGSRWGWVPGRFTGRPVYSPALVGFVGGGSGGVDWSVQVGSGRPGVAWFPLGPGEAWRPGFRASTRYLDSVNRAAVVRSQGGRDVFVHQRRPEALTAVSADDFNRGRPTRDHLERLTRNDLASAQVVAPPSMPGRGGFGERGRSGNPTRAVPPPEVQNRAVIGGRGERPAGAPAFVPAAPQAPTRGQGSFGAAESAAQATQREQQQRDMNQRRQDQIRARQEQARQLQQQGQQPGQPVVNAPNRTPRSEQEQRESRETRQQQQPTRSVPTQRETAREAPREAPHQAPAPAAAPAPRAAPAPAPAAPVLPPSARPRSGADPAAGTP